MTDEPEKPVSGSARQRVPTAPGWLDLACEALADDLAAAESHAVELATDSEAYRTLSRAALHEIHALARRLRAKEDARAALVQELATTREAHARDRRELQQLRAFSMRSDT